VASPSWCSDRDRYSITQFTAARAQFIAFTATVKRGSMIVLGVVLLIGGLIAAIPILLTLGIILVVIGIFLALLGMAGHAVGGRRHYY
jgi:uncharacterized membrane protein HdeD (DUF308 family)